MDKHKNEINDFLNNYIYNGSNYHQQLLLDLINCSHRTHQQKLFNIIREIFKMWAENYEKDCFDLRNEYTVKKAKEIMEILEYPAPFI